MSETIKITNRILGFEKVFWGIAIIAILIAAVATVLGPIGVDQNCFAYDAWRLLHGARPGIELWDLKPPFLIYYYAAFFKIFGASEFSLLLGDTFIQLAGMCVFVWGAARQGAVRLGITTVLTYGLLYYFVIPQADHGQVESVANGFTLAGCGIVLGLGGRWIGCLVGGWLFGITFWTKVFPCGFGLLFAAAIICFTGQKNDRRKKLASAVVGVISGVVTWFLIWSWDGNGLQVLRDLADARRFQGGLQNPLQITPMMRWFFVYGLGWGVATLLIAARVEWGKALKWLMAGVTTWGWLTLVATWSLLAGLIVIFQGKYFPYHFMHMLLPMSLMTGICHAARKEFGAGHVRRQRIANVLVCLMALGLCWWRHHASIRESVNIGCGRQTVVNAAHLLTVLRDGNRETYKDWLGDREIGENRRSDRMKASLAVSRLTLPDEKVLFLDGGQTAFWSRRLSYLRYYCCLPVQRIRFYPELAGSPLSKAVAAQIRSYPGNVVVWDSNWFPTNVCREADELRADFEVNEKIGPFQILTRMNPPARKLGSSAK